MGMKWTKGEMKVATKDGVIATVFGTRFGPLGVFKKHEDDRYCVVHAATGLRATTLNKLGDAKKVVEYLCSVFLPSFDTPNPDEMHPPHCVILWLRRMLCSGKWEEPPTLIEVLCE